MKTREGRSPAMLIAKSARRSTFHSPGLLRELYQWLRGGEQVLVRPVAELPLVLISYPKGDGLGAAHLRESLEATWLTLPQLFRQRYGAILNDAPPLVVVLLRRRNICSCLGHHHPPGTESWLTRRLRNLSGVRTGELDLAYEAIRHWEPLPLSHLALPPEADTEELSSFQWQLALLAVFLHEMHHLVCPQEQEHDVRGHSQRFYTDALAHFVSERYGVQFGLWQVSGY
ncbi:MAG: hypothetical protein HY648_11530 [Acidobacteria bacterium]|nr:hypothetical protein [Acidobacteriota bacterium]